MVKRYYLCGDEMAEDPTPDANSFVRAHDYEECLAALHAAKCWLFDDGGSRICDEETAQAVNEALDAAETDAKP